MASKAGNIYIGIGGWTCNWHRSEMKTGVRKPSLRDRGIAYLHLRGLGTPKPGRLARRSGKFDLLHEIYAAHLQHHGGNLIARPRGKLRRLKKP